MDIQQMTCVVSQVVVYTISYTKIQKQDGALLVSYFALRLDWLWFLGYDLDSEVPNHSVLSKARARWGMESFRKLLERAVWQCMEAGLVDTGGRTLSWLQRRL
jgi:hypothetical protein